MSILRKLINIFISGQSIHPFCNKVKRDPLETECTDDRSSVALCNLVRHVNELPSHFQVYIDIQLRINERLYDIILDRLFND